MTSDSNKSKWLIFILVAVAQFMVVLDSSITNVALAKIASSLKFANESALQWVITAYAITFGGFLLLGGRAADIFGRKKVLLGGIYAFTFFSLLIGLSTSTITLTTLRAFQGLAAAFMSPAALSIVLSTFPDGTKERNRALAYWSIVATGGAAAGLLVGGFLTQFFGWRWNFFINVPIGLVMSYFINKDVPAYKQKASTVGLDLPGAVLITSALILFVYTISQTATAGWLSMHTITFSTAFVVLLVLFVVNESRTKHPLVPLSIFKNRNVTAANLMMVPLYATMLGLFFLLSLYIQNILKLSPFITGLSFLPFPITLAITSNKTPGLVHKFGAKPLLVTGALLIILGLTLLTGVSENSKYIENILPAFILIPMGIGLSFMPIYASASSGVPVEQAGLASGLVNTSQQMGGAIGLAVLSSITAYFSQAAANQGATAAMINGFQKAFSFNIAFPVITLFFAIFILRSRVRG